MMGSIYHNLANCKLFAQPQGARLQARALCRELGAQPDDRYTGFVPGTGACVPGTCACPRKAHPPNRRAAEPSVSADSDGWPRGEGSACCDAAASPAFASLLCAASSLALAGNAGSAAPAEPCAAAGAGAGAGPSVGRFNQRLRRRSRAARAARGVRPDASHPRTPPGGRRPRLPPHCFCAVRALQEVKNGRRTFKGRCPAQHDILRQCSTKDSYLTIKVLPDSKDDHPTSTAFRVRS